MNSKTTKAKIIFAGTDSFAVTALETLNQEGWKPDLMLTTPDRPAGRKLKNTPSPVKVWSEKNQIPICQPADLQNYKLPKDNWDVLITASYGLIIPEHILNTPRTGALNIHPSLLPQYRGPSPITAAILSEDTKTGVTIMVMDKKMDHGPILDQTTTAINNKWYKDLETELATTGARMISSLLPKWLSGEINPKPQEHKKATYTKKITKSDSLIDLTEDPEINWKKIKAYTPDPGVYFFLPYKNQDLRVIITDASLVNNKLKLNKIKPAGKPEMKWSDWSRNINLPTEITDHLDETTL